MTRTKICGITREADLRVAVEAGADAVGVVAGVSVDTPREVSVERAADLLASVPPFVTSVLVTMGDAEAVRERVATVRPDAVQVHGFDPVGVSGLADAPAAVIAAVDADGDVAAVAEPADAVLVDSLDEQGGGGTGTVHDWERTRALVEDLETPVVLAGGLTPENVADAVETVDPFAVDVASGVEESGGVKDHAAVRAFVERATGEVVSA